MTAWGNETILYRKGSQTWQEYCKWSNLREGTALVVLCVAEPV